MNFDEGKFVQFHVTALCADVFCCKFNSNKPVLRL